MKAPANYNPMWIAITVIGGIVAYSMLKKDVVAVAEKVGDGAKYVADKANPLSQTNVVNSVITATGEAIAGKSWSLGTQIYDWTHPNEGVNAPSTAKTKKPEIKYQSTNNRASNYQAPATATTPRAAKKDDAGLPARQYNGKWLKLQKGQWLPLTKSDKVFTIRGANVVHHYLWKP